jgi:hypothetical protein
MIPIRRMASAVRKHCRTAAVVFTYALITCTSPAIHAQSLSSGPDQLVTRYCTDNCEQKNEKLVVDGAGNGMAVWQEPGSKIMVARYYAASGTWGAPTHLYGATGEDAHIGVDGRGNVMVIWSRYIGEWQVEVNFSRYMPTNGAWSWTRPATAFIHNEFEMTIRDLVVGKNGDAFLFYREWYRPYDNLKRFDAATGTWTHSASLFNIDSAGFAMDDAGNLVAAYATDLGYYYYEGTRVWTQRYDAATKQWSTGKTVDSHEVAYDDYGNNINGELAVRSLALSVDPWGHAMVFWERVLNKNGTTTRGIKTARYLKTRDAWYAKTLHSISHGKTSGAALAADRFGNVNAVWNQYVGLYAKTVSARYSSTTGTWTKPIVIQAGEFNTRDPNVKTDVHGNAIATWSQRTDSGTLSSASAIHRTTAARYAIASNTWGTPVTVQDANRNGYRPYLGVDVKGRALVMWTQQSGRVVNGVPVKEIRSDRLFSK